MSKFCAKNVGQPGMEENRQNVQILAFSIFLTGGGAKRPLENARFFYIL